MASLPPIGSLLLLTAVVTPAPALGPMGGLTVFVVVPAPLFCVVVVGAAVVDTAGFAAVVGLVGATPPFVVVLLLLPSTALFPPFFGGPR